MCYKNSNDLLSSFDITEGSADPVMVQCGRVIEDACTTIKEDGWLYTPPLVHGYRDFLVGLGKTHPEVHKLSNCMLKYLENVCEKNAFCASHRHGRLFSLLSNAAYISTQC